MLKAERLTKIYPDGTVGVENLDLEVAPGEIYCLLGANGAGKTTTINLFLNFLVPTSGRCLVDGIEVDRNPLEAKKRLSYLSERVMLYGTFTARANLDFFARIAGRRNLRAREADDLLIEVGLPAESLGRKVKTFSKGMLQKLGIAIAMVKAAPVLILDEPLSGLDPKAASEIVEILDRLRGQGKAILMSTHDIFRAKNLADRIAIMKDGHKVMERRREELEQQDLEALYLEYMHGTRIGGRRSGDSEKPHSADNLTVNS